MLPLASPPSSDDEEAREDEHDIHTCVRGAGRGWAIPLGWMSGGGTAEGVPCSAETMLGAVDREATDARATVMVTHTELIGELNFFASFAKLLLILTLNLRVSQRSKSS